MTDQPMFYAPQLYWALDDGERTRFRALVADPTTSLRLREEAQVRLACDARVEGGERARPAHAANTERVAVDWAALTHAERGYVVAATIAELQRAGALR